MSRPYFETEVVKIKKPYCKIHNQPICSNLLCKEFWGCEVVEAERRKKFKMIGNCPCCGAKTENKKPKGNWVNGENLDAIKFPCFCWYLSGAGKRYCELDFINKGEGFYRIKELKQHKEKDYHIAEFWNLDLEKLIKALDIHILKGKIIIYEEE